MSKALGFSGAIAAKFQNNAITPLLALVGLLLGVFAVLVTPREEEPQIDVTFANVFIPFPGATAKEVEQLISAPAEQMLSGIAGIEHTYSISRPGLSTLAVQFEVGESRTDAIVRLYNRVFSNQNWLPKNLGALDPIIKPKGIDDVPVVSFTLWSEDENKGRYELAEVAHALEGEFKHVKGTRDVYTVGTPDRVVHILLDPAKLAGYGISLDALRSSLLAANASTDAGALIGNNQRIPVQVGSFLVSPEEASGLVVGLHNGSPIYLGDVASVVRKADQTETYSWTGFGPAAVNPSAQTHPSVTIAITKKAGENAVEIAEKLIEKSEQLKGIVIPEGINIIVTRDYGLTANDKAMTLIKKLVFATGAVILLVLIAMGWREAFVVGVAVTITLTITLFASWAYGFTLNRVSLFALIFSIGILVDDAIVVVENIHRHMQLGERDLLKIIPIAVDEVGGPTILATFTVIAALLPMAFVSGLMGPYMSPIPINASMGMLFSLAVAFVLTPWLTYKMVRNHHVSQELDSPDKASSPLVQRMFSAMLNPFLRGGSGRPWRYLLGLFIIFLIAASASLAYFQLVVMKMLPFDNKSEFQVIVDMPEGTPVEQTARVLAELGVYLSTVPEVLNYQAYAGTAAPINFNGLVRQYYLRADANTGDLQVNLIDKKHRERKSHDIALAVREPLQEIGMRLNANVKIVEVPPGPPVQAPLVAEIYGPDYAGQIETAKRVREVFENTNDIVDIDDTVETEAERVIIHVDRAKAALLGVSQQTIAADLNAALRGEDVGFLHNQHVKYPIPLRMELPVSEKAKLDNLLALKVPGRSGQLVPLSDIVNIETARYENAIYHKDLLPVVFVTADMAGELDSPLYGMAAIASTLADAEEQAIPQYLINQPEYQDRYSLKWDGEWQITYETFRDMGLAYSVGLILIYLLVVAQFRSYMVPLIIMAPIPLTLIGVMPGHALFGAQFTATSMIGMIALAGIIVRNSILLVDFVNLEVERGVEFQKAVIQSSAVRAKPIILTGFAAMLGAMFILDDPIFQGLAISLIFGILVSTLMTLIVVPVLYYAFMYKRMALVN